jgi:hypothetical protein
LTGCSAAKIKELQRWLNALSFIETVEM